MLAAAPTVIVFVWFVRVRPPASVAVTVIVYDPAVRALFATVTAPFDATANAHAVL